MAQWCSKTTATCCFLMDSKRNVFKPCTNTMRSFPFNFTLCIQCVEYIDRNRVYEGKMTMLRKDHLHILETSPAIMHAT
jgi:hypothetical protein